MLQFDLLTLFPRLLSSPFSATILARAVEKGLIRIECHDIRNWATDRHRTVDDRSYGGGAGMVMKPEPAVRALEAVALPGKKVRRIYFSPQGRRLEQRQITDYLAYDQLLLLCGRYEGIDERILEFVDEEVSIGDYILTGGEFAAMVFVDAVARLVPGVVGKEESVRHETFSEGLLEYPQYTRPEEFRGLQVPEVLLSGNHAEVEVWRREQALERTRRRRPDLLKK